MSLDAFSSRPPPSKEDSYQFYRPGDNQHFGIRLVLWVWLVEPRVEFSAVWQSCIFIWPASNDFFGVCYYKLNWLQIVDISRRCTSRSTLLIGCISVDWVHHVVWSKGRVQGLKVVPIESPHVVSTVFNINSIFERNIVLTSHFQSLTSCSYNVKVESLACFILIRNILVIFAKSIIWILSLMNKF